MCDDDHSGSTRAVSGAKVIDLTEFPGEFPKQHDAYAWNQKAKGRLGNLLVVAQGEWPAAAKSIVEPVVVVAHRDERPGSLTEVLPQ